MWGIKYPKRILKIGLAKNEITKIHNAIHYSFTFWYIAGGPVGDAAQGGHDHGHGHSHDHEHGHTHEHMENPGRFTDRDMPVSRKDWKEVRVC